MRKAQGARSLLRSVERYRGPVRWYVLANRTFAVIYSEEGGKRPAFRERLLNPKGSHHESTLVSDRAGRVISKTAGSKIRHGFTKKFSKHEMSAKRFAKRIATHLDEARFAEAFDEIVLIAEPHFLGILKDSLSDGLSRKVKGQVAREFRYAAERDWQEHAS